MTSSNGNVFRVTGHLCGKFIGPRWIPHTKASDAELWCFLWSMSKYTVEKTIARLVIWDAIVHYDVIVMVKLDMSTARRRLKRPRSLSVTSARPIMVTLVNIMLMNGWLTSFSFNVNRPSYSWDKAISNYDLKTPRSKSRVWSKGKVVESTQYPINPLPFHSRKYGDYVYGNR